MNSLYIVINQTIMTARLALIKSVLFSLFFSWSYLVEAQVPNYSWTTDISYILGDKSNESEYAKKQKVLDIGHVEVEPKDLPVIIWFHGGGLTSGNNNIPDGLKREGYLIVSADYRLAPQVPAEVAIDDAAEAIAWVFSNIKQYGGDPEKIFVAGHSAGAYLAMMALMDKRRLETYQIRNNQVAGLIPLSGHTITHFQIRKERGLSETDVIVDDLAPLAYISEDLPPFLLITGDREKELLGRYEENAYFMRMMKVAGHQDIELLELDGYGHLMTEPAFPLLFEFVDRVLSKN